MESAEGTSASSSPHVQLASHVSLAPLLASLGIQDVMPPEQQRERLGLPPLALQIVLQHLPTQAKQQLLKCSGAVRDDVLMCAPDLTFSLGHWTRADSNTLRQLLSRRTTPMRLKLDVVDRRNKEEAVTHLLAQIEATPRPASQSGHEMPTCCCVQTLVLQGEGEVQSWGALLGAAFPRIATLAVQQTGDSSDESDEDDDPALQLNTAMLRGLAACSRLTSLDLSGASLAMDLDDGVRALLPRWLPHVHVLTYTRNEWAGLLAALAPQLQHVVLDDTDESRKHLPACRQLASLTVHTLDEATLQALLQLPCLRELTAVCGLISEGEPGALQQDFSTAEWSVRSLYLGSEEYWSEMEPEQLARLPLRSLRAITIHGDLLLRLQLGTAARASGGGVVRAACNALARVPQITCRPFVSVSITHHAHAHAHGPAAGKVEVGAIGREGWAAAIEAALCELQPLAHHTTLQELSLNLDFPCNEWEVGGEVLRGLHTAFGSQLNSLEIGTMFDPTTSTHQWVPGPTFWSTLLATLPSLTSLWVHWAAPPGRLSAAALTMACNQLQRAGRSFKLTFEVPRLHRRAMRELAQLLTACEPEVLVQVETAQCDDDSEESEGSE